MIGRLLVPLALIVGLGGCAAAVPPVSVTRFHGAAVPSGETVAIAPAEGMDGGGIEYRTFADAVAAALTRTGFTVVEPGRPAALTAAIGYDRAVFQPLDQRGSPVSVGVGGSTGSYGSGVGLGIGIDLSGRPKPLIGTRLSVRLKRGATGEPLWEGRAETQAKEGTPAAQPGIAAGKLADALFRDYPGEAGATITVK